MVTPVVTYNCLMLLVKINNKNDGTKHISIHSDVVTWDNQISDCGIIRNQHLYSITYLLMIVLI